MSNTRKEKKWFKPMFEGDEDVESRNKSEIKNINAPHLSPMKNSSLEANGKVLKILNVNHKSWMKNFDPKTVEDLAVHNKKVQEVDEWLKLVSSGNNSDILLLTGPVGCGKTTTLNILAAKHNIKITEWITPLDIYMPMEDGEFEFKVKQSTQFLDFIIKAANFTSLLDNNNKKLVLVEDFPNTFTRTPLEFTEVLQQYKLRAKSPIVFICSECYNDTRNSTANLFTPALKEQFSIQHIVFNGVSPTGLKSALKRVVEIISKKYTSVYNIPQTDLIDCVANSSSGDVRSAVLNLHFACLKGSSQNLETSLLIEKETKKSKKKKTASCKFTSLGKDQTVSILHGVGRVLNPKVIIENGQKRLTYAPEEIIEQFISQPSSFVGFIWENYLPHFSSADHVEKAASALSDADYLLAEWREKICQEYGLYISVAGMMLSNETPVSAWNPVRGPKNMKIQYPTSQELQLEENYLYMGKTLTTDYKTYCKIIGHKKTLSSNISGLSSSFLS